MCVYIFSGFYCVLGEITPRPTLTSTGGPCEQGTYCPVGSSSTTPCPAGTYGNRPNMPLLTDCTNCEPGYYCDGTGLTEPSGTCLEGFYCTGKAILQNPINESYGDECPNGHYCPQNSSQPTPCNSGYYQPLTRRTSENDCIICTPGEYCTLPGQNDTTGLCSAGYYCIEGAESASPTDGITGDICPIGSYCPVNSVTHYTCLNGTYTNSTGNSECSDCPDSYYCSNSIDVVPCPSGYYCPPTTGLDWQACPAGTYNPSEMKHLLSDCVQCDGGKYCSTTGLSAPDGNCTQGFFCEEGINQLFHC